jgi:hypothetical protein
MENKKMKKEKKIKDLKPSAYDMTDEEVAKSVDLELSDFDDSGDMIEELRDIMEGNYNGV